MYYVYTAVFTKGKNGYTVEVPDVPGCVTDGQTLEEATRMVKDALGGSLCTLEDHGEHPAASRVPSDLDFSLSLLLILIRTVTAPKMTTARYVKTFLSHHGSIHVPNVQE